MTFLGTQILNLGGRYRPYIQHTVNTCLLCTSTYKKQVNTQGRGFQVDPRYLGG